MKQLFVPYEQSLELRELGFDEICLTHYWGNDILNEAYGGWMKNSNTKYVMSPTWEQTFKWFREKHNLHSEILLDRTTYPKYSFEIHRYEDFGNYEKIENQDWSLYRTFEEAQLTCLNEIIKLVKTK